MVVDLADSSVFVAEDFNWSSRPGNLRFPGFPFCLLAGKMGIRVPSSLAYRKNYGGRRVGILFNSGIDGQQMNFGVISLQNSFFPLHIRRS